MNFPNPFYWQSLPSVSPEEFPRKTAFSYAFQRHKGEMGLDGQRGTPIQWGLDLEGLQS